MKQTAYDFEQHTLEIGDEVIFYTAPAWLHRGTVTNIRPFGKFNGTLVEVVTKDGTTHHVIPGLCAKVA